jgi:hypothetical protein
VDELAVVVLAHDDPEHVTRLVGALDGLPVFLHCDAKAPRAVSSRMPSAARVRALPRLDTRLSSWSLVAAELAGVQAALRSTGAEHVAVLSGADYPLLPVPELVDLLQVWQGRSFIYNRPLPFHKWDTRWRRDGGAWRTRYRVLRRSDNLVTVRGRHLQSPIPRRRPRDLELRASSQWKIYSRRDAEVLLRVTESRPDLVAFWRSTFIPEESYTASMLASPRLVGSAALPLCLANPWFLDFPDGGTHPRWLGDDDFDVLARARHAPPYDPTAKQPDPSVGVPEHRRLFARKFSSGHAGALVERIDAELRV